MKDIIRDVIVFIQWNDYFNILWDNIYISMFQENSDKNTSPSLCVKQVWWSKSWYYDVYFIVRAETFFTARPLWLMLVDVLCNQYTDNEIKWQEIKWWVRDEISDVWWYKETHFVIRFYDWDSI